MELLPLDVSLHIVKLSLTAGTYWTISLINRECYRYANGRVFDIFQSDPIKSFPNKKDATLNINTIVFEINTEEFPGDGVELSKLIMIFPNGCLHWEKGVGDFTLVEFYYEGDETNCEFLRKMYYVLEHIFNYTQFEYGPTYECCECNKCIELNEEGDYSCCPTPQILDLKLVTSTNEPNRYFIKYKTNIMSLSRKRTESIITGLVTYSEADGKWGNTIQGDVILREFGQSEFCGNYQYLLTKKAFGR